MKVFFSFYRLKCLSLRLPFCVVWSGVYSQTYGRLNGEARFRSKLWNLYITTTELKVLIAIEDFLKIVGIFSSIIKGRASAFCYFMFNDLLLFTFRKAAYVQMKVVFTSAS